MTSGVCWTQSCKAPNHVTVLRGLDSSFRVQGARIPGGCRVGVVARLDRAAPVHLPEARPSSQALQPSRSVMFGMASCSSSLADDTTERDLKRVNRVMT